MNLVEKAEAEESQQLTARRAPKPAVAGESMEAMVVQIRGRLRPTGADQLVRTVLTDPPAPREAPVIEGRTVVGGRPAPTAPTALPAPIPLMPPGPTLERLISVLKGSGLSFKDAVAVLKQLGHAQHVDKATLRSLWASTSAPERRGEPVDPRVDLLVRPASRHATDTPTLAQVVVQTPLTQAYVADLTTAEYQRLALILGDQLPEWFASVRPARGLRGFVERPAIAHLVATQVLGTSLLGWLAAGVGVAGAWTAGTRYGVWW